MSKVKILALLLLFSLSNIFIYSAIFPVNRNDPNNVADSDDFSDPFGPRKRTNGSYDFHEGVDIGDAPEGTEVVAVYAGEILFTQNNTIYLVHGKGTNHEEITKYLHIDRVLSWKKGDMVNEGDLLGTVDNQIHLHFGWMPNTDIGTDPVSPGDGDLKADNPSRFFNETGIISGYPSPVLVDKDGNGNKFLYFRSLYTDKNGNLYFSGDLGRASSTIKLDKNLDLQWSKTGKKYTIFNKINYDNEFIFYARRNGKTYFLITETGELSTEIESVYNKEGSHGLNLINMPEFHDYQSTTNIQVNYESKEIKIIQD